MRLLLDTNIVIDVLHSNPSTIGMLAEATRRGDRLTTSAVVVAEVYAGIRVGEEQRTHEVVEGLACLAVTQRVARRGGELKMHLVTKRSDLSPGRRADRGHRSGARSRPDHEKPEAFPGGKPHLLPRPVTVPPRTNYLSIRSPIYTSEYNPRIEAPTWRP